MHNESYWLLLRLRKPLPVDIYDPLEAAHPACSADSFTGGLGMIQVVRYSETPVGPYDELLLIPGNFSVPSGSQKSKKRLRVSRIYVSQKETTWNGKVLQGRKRRPPLTRAVAGRKNWNLPKHLARFEFSAPPVKKGTPPPKELTVAVFPHGSTEGDTARPFFQATLTPVRSLPALPFSTKWSPLNTMLIQPPLPQGDDRLLCGTDTWKALEIGFRSRRARLMWVGQADEDAGAVAREGHWPGVRPWRIGLWLEAATLEVPVPHEWAV